MSLLDNLSYKESQAALDLTSDECDSIVNLAKIKDLSYRGITKPGQKLLNDLNKRGYSADQYRNYILTAKQTINKSFYPPQIKLAILIGNNNYENLSNLATPVTDCESLANYLRKLGFVAIIIQNVSTGVLRNILYSIFSVVPQNSYCFIFYAGHGFELCNIKYILCTDSPSAYVIADNCISENCILNYAAKCKPELCILIMDMCRISLDRESNPNLYSRIPNIPDYKIDGNLFIVYSTQSAMSAYEMIQIECSQTIENMSYVLQTGDSKFLVMGTSQYVGCLCSHLEDRIDVSLMLDKVHEDLENAPKKQIPIKVQSGVAKRSLHDLTMGNSTNLVKTLNEVINIEEFKEYCSFY